MDCICEFKTESFKTLRRHFSQCHGNEKLFSKHFSHTFMENWDVLGWDRWRRILFDAADNKCSRCGYCETRECGGSILEIDHIDGNTENNAFENFQVLCPNCHALTPKYRNWGNHGNKKTSARLRKGNVDYNEHIISIKEEKEKARLERAHKKVAPKQNNKRRVKQHTDDPMIDLKEMKLQFQKEFKEEVLRLHTSGEIDFSKYGWVQMLAEKTNDAPQNVGRRVRQLLPTFYVENCFKRNQYLYEKRSKLE